MKTSFVVAAFSIALSACGSYQKQVVDRPPLIDGLDRVHAFELVDVHLAGDEPTAEDLLSYREKTLNHLRTSARRVLGVDAKMSPEMETARGPIADASKGCIARDAWRSDAWTMAVFVSAHESYANSLLAPILATKTYFVTVTFAVWDGEGHLVDRSSIIYTKDDSGTTRSHADFPPDDELYDRDIGIEGIGNVGQPLWLRGVEAGLHEYLANFRPSRVPRFVRTGTTYQEPRERSEYRARHTTRPSAIRCSR